MTLLRARLSRQLGRSGSLAYQRTDRNVDIADVGHRCYIGGMWDEIGALQFRFMRSQGLLAEHVLLDIACGSLRGGVHFIPFLDSGNYLGIEKEGELVRLGLERELGTDLQVKKLPEFVISDTFRFEQFSKRPDYAIAQSLFTHLPPADIIDCLIKLRAFAPTCRLFATFLTTRKARTNRPTRNDHEAFYYTKDEMRQFAHASGWRFRYIGDWDHPRGQVMAEYG